MQWVKNVATFVMSWFKMKLEKNAAVRMELNCIVIAVMRTLQLVVEPERYVQEQLA